MAAITPSLKDANLSLAGHHRKPAIGRGKQSMKARARCTCFGEKIRVQAAG
jgi:hypothetical protein